MDFATDWTRPTTPGFYDWQMPTGPGGRLAPIRSRDARTLPTKPQRRAERPASETLSAHNLRWFDSERFRCLSHEPSTLTQSTPLVGGVSFVCALAAIARANPQAIRRLIADNGNGTYYVTIYRRDAAGKAPQTVEIDTRRIPRIPRGAERWAWLLATACTTVERFGPGSGLPTLAAQLDVFVPGEPESCTTATRSEIGLWNDLKRTTRERRPALARAFDFASKRSSDELFVSKGVIPGCIYSVCNLSELSGSIFLSEPDRAGHLIVSTEQFRTLFEEYVVGPPL
jgi:hypothetical protein